MKSLGNLLFSACCVLTIFCLRNSAAASTPTVVVSSPANNSTIDKSVHFVATATSTQCAKGIAAIRIYTAPHISPFTTNGAHLDATITLRPGLYNTVVQTWDNCGGVAKAPINFTVRSSTLQPARFLYLTTSSAANQRVFGYTINPQTGALTATNQKSVAGVSSSFALAADAGGFRLYVTPLGQFPNDDNIAAYFIDRRNGALSLVPGSPSFLGFSIQTLAVHPSGKFLYAATVDLGVGSPGVLILRVNSDGSLTQLTSEPVPTQTSPFAMAIDPSGRYLYATSDFSIDAFEINEISGELTPLPGSPFAVDRPCPLGVNNLIVDDVGRSLYIGSETLNIFAFNIQSSTGTLTNAPASPFFDPPAQDQTGTSCDGEITGLTVEPTGRFLFAGRIDGLISIFAINAGDGTLRFLSNTPKNYGQYSGSEVLAPDPSGKYLYTFGDSTPPGPNPLNEVIGFAIDQSTGTLTVLPSGAVKIDTALAQGFGIAVTP